MAYEAKVILASLADSAARTRSKKMYNIISKMASVEGVKMQSYAEAIAEIEAEDDEQEHGRKE